MLYSNFCQEKCVLRMKFRPENVLIRTLFLFSYVYISFPASGLIHVLLFLSVLGVKSQIEMELTQLTAQKVALEVKR